MGVDKHVLSIVPPLMGYGLDIGINMKIASSFNDHIVRLVSEHPDRFYCLATVPLQDPALAADELGRAVNAGHIGVQIGSNVAGRNLDDPELNIFWEKAASLDVPIFIHPINQLGRDGRLKNYQMGKLLGVPIENGIAAASLIFGGVLDRYHGIRIMLSHMGGILPWVMGRMEHGYHEREGANTNRVNPPLSYLRWFFYDTIVHDADCLEFAAKRIEEENILYRTDYPFDMGNLGPAEKIPGLFKLKKEVQAKILLDNATRFFGL